MRKTLTGVYASEAAAESAKQALSAANIDLENIRTVTPQDLPEANSSGSRHAPDESVGEKVADFITSFFDTNDTDELRESQRQAVRNGSSLVIVEPDTDLDAERAERILGSHLTQGSSAAKAPVAADSTALDSSADASDTAIGKPH